jgi:hypothetical protein
MANFVSIRTVRALLVGLALAGAAVSLTECGDLEPLPMATRAAH